MRLSIIIFFCMFMIVVNSATTKSTTRRIVTNGLRSTTKAPARKSAYAYLRSIRGRSSCSGGFCPFWERHGRSFAALRCYSQQYRECVCLHRMCFSSCMFSRPVCNSEMVICLKQICPRCMPASSLPMCQIYDSMAEKVADALSVFACYACCPVPMNSPMNNTNQQVAMPTTTPVGLTNGNTVNVATSTGNVGATTGINVGSTTIVNAGGNVGVNAGGNVGANAGGNVGVNAGGTPGVNAGGNVGVNAGGTPGVNVGVVPGSNQGSTNAVNNSFPGVFPGSGNMVRPNTNAANAPNQNQRVQQKVTTTKPRVVTTRRAAKTTLRRSITARPTTQVQKKTTKN